MTPLTTLRALGLVALGAAAWSCSSAAGSDASAPSNGPVSPGRQDWSPGAGTGGSAGGKNSQPTSGSTGSGGGAQATSDDGGTPPANALCPGVPVDDKKVALTTGRSRATVSPVQARGAVMGGALPAPASIQPGEFLNYYRIDYSAAEPTTDVAVVADLAPGAFTEEIVLQVGVRAPAAHAAHPAVITAVVDTSTPMAGPGIARAQAALDAILKSLEAGDVLNLLTSGSEKPQTFTLAGPSDPAASHAVGMLDIDGGGAFGAAVLNAYALANTAFKAGGTNRVVLVTGGGIPEAEVDFGLIAKNADAPGIGVVGVGVGPSVGYSDALLANATAAGRGPDLYLNDVAEADAMLYGRFDELMGDGARDVHVELTLPWYLTLATPAAVPGNAGTPTGTPVPTDLPPGRALVYRALLQADSCAASLLLQPNQKVAPVTIGVDVSYVPSGATASVHAAPYSVTIMSTVNTPVSSPHLLKANAVLALADALSGGDPLRWAAANQLVAALAYNTLFAGDADVPAMAALLAAEKPLLHN